MHSEVEHVARAFYHAADNARGWEREPEILRERFRSKAWLAIRNLAGYCRPLAAIETPASLGPVYLETQVSPPEPKRDPPGFLAVVEGPRHIFHLSNKAHRKLTGHRALIGRSVREAVPEIESQGFHELLDEVYETGRPYVGSRCPIRLRTRRNGEIEDRLIDVAYSPIVDGDGERLGVLIEGRDVTDRCASAPMGF